MLGTFQPTPSMLSPLSKPPLSVERSQFKWRAMGKAFSQTVFLLVATIAAFIPVSAKADALKISQIAMSNEGVPFLLDSEGNVWGFKKPYTLEDPVKLAIPVPTKKIKPFMALTADGHVYTWTISTKRSLSKDSSGDGSGDGSVAVTYTAPELEKNLPVVSDISYGSGLLKNDFYALGKNDSVYEWMRDAGPSPHDVSVRTVPGDVTSFSTSGVTTAYLLRDNRLRGWGANGEGQLPESLDLPEQARAVYVGVFHTFILTDTGNGYVWGGCHASGMAVTGDVPDVIEAVQYPLRDIQDIAVSMDDNNFPNIFLKKDGTVWEGFPPSDNIHNVSCGKTFSDESLVHHIEMPVPAVVIAIGGDGTHPYSILALDAQGGLWGANFREAALKNWTSGGVLNWGGAYKGFKKISVTLGNHAEEQK
jgi:hypothetical protein